MKLAEIVQRLERIAPLRFAGSWDNVGLLIDPGAPEKEINTLFVTNDLTENVMTEAMDKASNKGLMIVSYHPPIFRPLKRISADNWKDRIYIKCITNTIPVYSPHTALDAIQEGVNDWLVNPFAGMAKSVSPLEEVESGIGPGRLLELSQDNTITMDDALAKIKGHLGMDKVRVSFKRCDQNVDPKSLKVSSIAVCAGSGGSVLNTPLGRKADLWITGEMSHHEVLDAHHWGINVVLCDHSNTERGYLATDYVQKLSSHLPGVEVCMSQTDTDPLQVV